VLTSRCSRPVASRCLFGIRRDARGAGRKPISLRQPPPVLQHLERRLPLRIHRHHLAVEHRRLRRNVSHGFGHRPEPLRIIRSPPRQQPHGSAVLHRLNPIPIPLNLVLPFHPLWQLTHPRQLVDHRHLVFRMLFFVRRQPLYEPGQQLKIRVRQTVDMPDDFRRCCNRFGISSHTLPISQLPNLGTLHVYGIGFRLRRRLRASHPGRSALDFRGKMANKNG